MCCGRRGRRLRAASCTGAIWLATVASAVAHTGGSTGFASVFLQDGTLRYSLTLSPTALPQPAAELLHRTRAGQIDAGEELLALIRQKITVTADATLCAAGRGLVAPPPAEQASLTLIVDFACPRSIRQLVVRDDLFDALGSDHHTLGRIEARGQTYPFALEPTAREVSVTLAGSRDEISGDRSFFLLGVDHILRGYDHLLFLAALLLRGGSVRSLLKIVTAFTLAHSLTLAVAVLGVVSVPDRLVEALIAASIAWVALENLAFGEAPSRRWAVSFVFGLVHGFGFASALQPLVLPRGNLALVLLGFNLGIEAGQAAVVLAAMPFLLAIRQRGWEPRVVRAVSLALVVVGVIWFVQRLFFA
jgi:hydrogenase/urease accessory protein HupE